MKSSQAGSQAAKQPGSQVRHLSVPPFVRNVWMFFFLWFPSWQGFLLFPSLVLLLFMVSGCYRTAAVPPMETIKNHREFP